MSYQKHNFEPGAVLFASQLNDMDNQIEFLSNQGSSFSDNFKEALLNCFENVAWINENGQTYYDALYDSLYPDNMWFITNTLTGCTTSNNATNILKNNSYVATITASEGYTLDGATVSITMGGNNVTNLYYTSGSINIPNVTGDLVITVAAVSAVASVSAVFTQGSAIIYSTDNLNTLRQYLVVTATYSDSTTATVTDYTLSGTLTAGTSTITVSYGGKTDTFSVTVVSWDYAWDYSMGNLSANGFTMQTGHTGSAVLQEDGLLITSNRQFNKDNNPVCTTCVFETTFTLVSFDSNTTQNRGYRLIIFNGNRAVTLNVKESGLEAYNYTTTSYDIAAPVVLNKEYVLRVEAGQTTGKLYLDGELVLTVPLGTTAATKSIVAQIGKDNGRQTLVKNIRYSYQS